MLLTDSDRAMIVSKVDQALALEKNEELINNVEVKREQINQGSYDTTLYPLLGYWENYATIYDFVKDAQRNFKFG
ncbi:hypothetical protein MGH68_01230 [Erysipelothrix sp. D19-032]